jgi:hypothetical protein
MSSIAVSGFPVRPGSDRNAFLFFTSMVWVGVLSGFGTDSFSHVSQHGLDYPLIVHFHAVAFVSWLVLFTTQVLLIRSRRADLHRRLGVAGAVLAGVMVFLGPATALVYDAHEYAVSGTTPEFLAVQFTDILAFATLTGSGLLLRRNSPAHKRLMMLGLIYISDAGFARFLNALVAAPLGQTFWGTMVALYGGGDVLMLGLGAYDLATRRKLHPAYMTGVAVALTLQVTAIMLLASPGWKAITLHLIGH